MRMTTRRGGALTLALTLTLLSACAGRDARPVAVVQPQDQGTDCTAVTAELNANNTQISHLANEDYNRVAGNVLLAVTGAVLFAPALFLMDFKGAALDEKRALEARNTYLTTLMTQRCRGPVMTSTTAPSGPITAGPVITPVPAAVTPTTAPAAAPLPDLAPSASPAR